MKRITVLIVAIVAVLGVVGIGSAFAASGSQSTTAKTTCPYAKDGTPIRARDGSGAQANRNRVAKANAQTKKAKAQARVRNGAKAGAANGTKQRVRAQDGTGLKARTDVPHGDCDGTGPHGPYQGGR
jgi:hypothetical protein